jgi:hypothetical protein
MRHDYIFKLIKICCGISLIFSISNCKKFVTVNPPDTKVTGASVYNNDITATAVLTGIYTSLSSNGFTQGGLTSMSYYGSLSADELTLFSGSPENPFYSNALTSSNIASVGWNQIYPTIYVINSAIEGLTATTSLTPNIQQQLIGEAKFLRAFCYFYLVNLYSDVPLVTTTDYSSNALLPRTNRSQVYNQIIADLQDAKELLSTDYLDATLLKTTIERVRPTIWAATALLARTYLYTDKWDSAAAESAKVISNITLFQLPDLDNAFLANNAEAIWQLQPVAAGSNTFDAQTFILPTGPTTGNVYLDTMLVRSFEPGDQRRTHWIDSVIVDANVYYYAFKYKVNNLTPVDVTEYTGVLRLGEQYLISSEAKAHQGNISGPTGAVADLNKIRERAGLPDYSGLQDMSSVLDAIQAERRVELFTEWGHRWLDLKRTGTVDAIMTKACPLKGNTWNTIQQLYPIPLTELKLNPKLVQNPGY